MSMIRPEFAVHLLNDDGIQKAETLAAIFSSTLDAIERIVPAGRERALVITKMQEAAFFAKRGIAIDPLNQTAIGGSSREVDGKIVTKNDKGHITSIRKPTTDG
jgi:hypothetical protein